jgi:hypothetical protein
MPSVRAALPPLCKAAKRSLAFIGAVFTRARARPADTLLTAVLRRLVNRFDCNAAWQI